MATLRIRKYLSALNRVRYAVEDAAHDTLNRFRSRNASTGDTTDLYVSPNLHIVANIFDRSSPIVVNFTNAGMPRICNFETLSDRYRLNFINIACKAADWWQYPDMPAAIEKVAGFTAQFPKVIAYGTSMGGYAALMWGGMIGAGTIVVYSPQAAMGVDFPAQDTRWVAARNLITEEFGFPHDDMAAQLSRTADITVIYDPLSPDRLHVDMIEALRPIHRVVCPLSGHSTLRIINELKLGSQIVRSLVSGTFIPREIQQRLHVKRRTGNRADRAVQLLMKRDKRLPPSLIRAMSVRTKTLDLDVARQTALRLAQEGRDGEALQLTGALLRRKDYSHKSVLADIFAFPATTFIHPAAKGLGKRLEQMADARDLERPDRAAVLLCGARLSNSPQLALKAARLLNGWDDENGLVAKFLSDSDRPELAEPFRLRSSILTTPDFQAWDLIARAHQKANDWQKVIETWGMAYGAGMDPIRFAPSLSNAFVKLSRWQEAIYALEPALAVAAPSIHLVKRYAHCLVQLKRDNDAARVFTHIIGLDPNDAAAHSSLARILKARQDYTTALTHATAACAIDPSPSREQMIASLEKLLKAQARSIAMAPKTQPAEAPKAPRVKLFYVQDTGTSSGS